MTAFAVAHLRSAAFCPQIVAYLEAIDATLEPFGGRFLIHGGAKTVLEGSWPGDLIVLSFPDLEQARAWYDSPAYRRILDLRRNWSEGDLLLVEGVPEGHRATDILG